MPELLGEVARLQVHRSAVKADEVYDPAPLVSVGLASFDTGGMLGWDGSAWLVDNHHASYPGSGESIRRAVSIGFTSHYDAMYRRFGERVTPGIAAENIIVETGSLIPLDRIAGGIEIHTADGERLAFGDPLVAAPCREFTSCLLGLPRRAEREEIADDLEFLGDGMRGFVFGCQTVVQPVRVAVGDRVYVSD